MSFHNEKMNQGSIVRFPRLEFNEGGNRKLEVLGSCTLDCAREAALLQQATKNVKLTEISLQLPGLAGGHLCCLLVPLLAAEESE